jgi:hypothetical protein
VCQTALQKQSGLVNPSDRGREMTDLICEKCAEKELESGGLWDDLCGCRDSISGTENRCQSDATNQIVDLRFACESALIDHYLT